MSCLYDNLAAGYERIRDIEHWTQDTFARDGNGRECQSSSSGAVKFCAGGAMRGEDLEALHRAAVVLFGVSVVCVNDDQGVPREVAHANVLKVYEYAMALVDVSKP